MGRNSDENSALNADAAARAQRNSTLLVANCTRDDGSTFAIRVRNISSTGLKGECPELLDLATDETIKLVFRNLTPFAARIVRYEASEIGIKFDRSVDIDRLVKQQAAKAPIEQSPRSEAMREWIDLNDRLRRAPVPAETRRV